MGERSRHRVHMPGLGLKDRIATHLAKHPWQRRALYVGVPLAIIGSVYLMKLLQGEYSTPPVSGLEYHVYFTPDTNSDGLCATVDLASNHIPHGAAPVTQLNNGEARGLENSIGHYTHSLDTNDKISETKYGKWLLDLIYDVAKRAGLTPSADVNPTCSAFNNIGLDQANVQFHTNYAG